MDCDTVIQVPDGRTTFQLTDGRTFRLDVAEGFRKVCELSEEFKGKSGFGHFDALAAWIKEQGSLDAPLTAGEAEFVWNWLDLEYAKKNVSHARELKSLLSTDSTSSD